MMLEPNQSLKVGRSPVNNDDWNYVDELINHSTTDSPWYGVRNLSYIPIDEVTLFQLKIPTKISIKKNLKNVRT